MHHVFFLLVVMFWGTSFLLMKYATAAFGPMTVGGGRVLGGGVFMLVLVAMHAMRQRDRDDVTDRAGDTTQPSHAIIRWRDVPALWPIVILGSAFPFAMQPHLIGKYQDSAYFGTLVCLAPLFTVVLTPLLLRERVPVRSVLGVAGGLVFCAMLAGDALNRRVGIGDFLLGCCVPLGYACSNVWVKRRFPQVPPSRLLVWTLLPTSVILLTLGFTLEPWPATWSGEVGLALAATAWLGVVNSGIAIWLFYFLVQARGPLFPTMVTYLVPVVAMFWGALDGERVTLVQMLAVAGVLSMVSLTQFGGAKPDAVQAEP